MSRLLRTIAVWLERVAILVALAWLAYLLIALDTRVAKSPVVSLTSHVVPDSSTAPSDREPASDSNNALEHRVSRATFPAVSNLEPG
jgi:hypothetical protein